MQPLNENQTRQIIKEEFDKNYRSGNTAIPPHKHTGIDNLQIEYKDLIGIPTSSGSAAGSNTQIQFNDNGVFGASENFTFDSNTSTLGVPNIVNTNSPDDPVFNAISMQIYTVDIPFDQGGNTGSISMFTGSGGFDPGTGTSDNISGDLSFTTGTSNKETGSIDIITGGAIGNPSPNSGISGDINITTGFAYGDAGDINITTGNSVSGNGGTISLFSGPSSSGTAGDITAVSSGGIQLIAINTGQQILIQANAGLGSSVAIQGGDLVSISVPGGSSVDMTGGTVQIQTSAGYVWLGPTNTVNLGQTLVDITGMLDYIGSVTIADRLSGTPITGSPVGGGMLYSEGGALYWLGSSGTLTMIAPS